jgi:choline dehydrogenase
MSEPRSQEFDYVVIGAGGGGCVVANRLTADPNTRVLLLEAGPPDANADIHNVALTSLFALWSPQAGLDWGYSTEPEPGLGGRQMPVFQGKVAGGGTSVHGRIFIRGNRRDFDHWNYLGNENWGYDDLLPYMKKSETYLGPPSEFRGTDGPLPVMDLPKDRRSEASEAFVAGCAELTKYGFKGDWDFNAGVQEGGAGYIQSTTTPDFQRASAYTAYIDPIKDTRKNLTIVTEAYATKILFQGTKAVGLEYLKDGRTEQVRVTNEVVVSMGALNSPKLLLQSGVGRADDLKKLGIPVVADVPGVGENLQDHLNVRMCWAASREQQIPMIICESSLFTYSRQGVPLASPDLQLFFGGFAFPETGAAFNMGFALVPVVCRPTSVGRLWLRSNNPMDPPAFNMNYLTTDYDMSVLLYGMELGREIVNTKAFEGLRGAELLPGPEIGTDVEKLKDYTRRTCITDWHPSGSCKMGLDSMAVVDPRLRVYGVEGVRIVDASIMPSVVSGNIQASVFAIGEKGADMILQDA